MEEDLYLYNEMTDTKTRFVSFLGEESRYDLAIVITDRFFGKKLVLDLQGSRFAIIGDDDLEEEGYLEHAFRLSSSAAAEMKNFLLEII